MTKITAPIDVFSKSTEKGFKQRQVLAGRKNQDDDFFGFFGKPDQTSATCLCFIPGQYPFGTGLTQQNNRQNWR
jgi:hypothetical protein